MKKDVAPWMIIVAAVVVVVVLAVVGYQVINPQRETQVDPAQTKKHMTEMMQRNSSGAKQTLNTPQHGGSQYGGPSR